MDPKKSAVLKFLRIAWNIDIYICKCLRDAQSTVLSASLVHSQINLLPLQFRRSTFPSSCPGSLPGFHRLKFILFHQRLERNTNSVFRGRLSCYLAKLAPTALELMDLSAEIA